MRTFALAEVKAADPSDAAPNGEFTAVLSKATVDRDGEIVDAGAFDPLPASIPVHAFHNFSDPVGIAQPYYEDGVLFMRGRFASTPRAQEVRQLVVDGVIGHTSVGFMAARREEKDGVQHVTRAELLEGSFVSVPANRDAAVLVAKHYAEQAGTATSVDTDTKTTAIPADDGDAVTPDAYIWAIRSTYDAHQEG